MKPAYNSGAIDLMAVETQARRLRALYIRDMFFGRKSR